MTNKKTKESDFKVLNDREHVLARPGMYVGAVKRVSRQGFALSADGAMEWREFTYVPALLKIVNEILDNCIDEYTRSKVDKFKIDIEISKEETMIVDSGRGIPIKNESTTGLPIPLLAWTRAKSGSNFDDDDRKTIGMNGIGSFATNVLSKEFYAETADGEQIFKLTCTDNMENVTHKISKCAKPPHTRVRFKPDFKLFEGAKDGFDAETINLLKTRVVNLSVAFPNIQFTFNGEKLKHKSFKSWCEQKFEHCEMIDAGNVKICVIPNKTDDFNYIQYVNGLDVYEGGNILNWTLTNIIDAMKAALPKQWRGVKPGDIKNKIGMVLFVDNLNDAKFDSQSKTKCINSPAEFKSIFADVDFEKFGKVIIKNAGITGPMMDYLKFKEEFRERQELKDISKKISSKKIDKFYPPIGKNKYLVLGEGDSAVNGLMKVLGRSEFGYFPLRGKPLNCLEVPISKIGTNAETSNVINILDLDLTKQSDTMSFDNVLIATDADADGISIRGLLLAFFYRMTPELLKSGKIKFLKTPLVAVYNKKTLECHKWFFTLSEYTKWQGDHETESHKYKHQYYKGLGTWVEKDLKAIFAKDGLDKFIFDCTLDHEGNDSINEWMGKAFADTRKSKLTDMSFDINAI